MRRLLYASLTLGALMLALSGCGATRLNFHGQQRQAAPIDLSVYVNNSHMLVSPQKVGAGPVQFNVTNQASRTESVTISRVSGDRRAVASTGPINPNSSAQVTVDFTSGDYSVSTQTICSACDEALRSSVAPVIVRIGVARTAGDSALLQP